MIVDTLFWLSVMLKSESQFGSGDHESIVHPTAGPVDFFRQASRRRIPVTSQQCYLKYRSRVECMLKLATRQVKTASESFMAFSTFCPFLPTISLLASTAFYARAPLMGEWRQERI